MIKMTSGNIEGRVLTMSLQDYISMVDKKYSDYTAVGVHHYCAGDADFIIKKGSPEKLWGKAPENTEIIVDYLVTVGGAGNGKNQFFQKMAGTALVPIQLTND